MPILFFKRSLQEYILISQDKAVVEIFFKQSQSDLWRISRFEGLDSNMIARFPLYNVAL